MHDVKRMGSGGDGHCLWSNNELDISLGSLLLGKTLDVSLVGNLLSGLVQLMS